MFHPDVCTGINLIETGKRIDAVMRANGGDDKKACACNQCHGAECQQMEKRKVFAGYRESFYFLPDV